MKIFSVVEDFVKRQDEFLKDLTEGKNLQAEVSGRVQRALAKTCSQCGQGLSRDAKFCPRCGAKAE